MAGSGLSSDPGKRGGGWDIHALFCHYNALYFHDSLGACAVSWADSPLPHCATSTCHYYPGGGCDILLSKSLLECQTNSYLKNALLHEMIHSYMCINHENTDHSDHGPSFQSMMNAINSSSIPDQHRPVGGYNITVFHEIRKKFHHYKCETCGDSVKTTKIRGPSHDDCIESMGPDALCQNSMCHWHSHKKLCLGSYYKVQESPGPTEVKSSKAEEALVEGKAKELTHGVQHIAHGSNNRGTSNKHDLKKDVIAEFLHPVVGEAADSSGLDSASRDDSHKKVKLLKDIESKAQTATTVLETPKRPRTTASKNQGCSRPKKRKLSKHDNGYSVIIEWLDVFAVEEADEDEEPLINKRTERRKKQKLLKFSQARASNNGVKNAGSPSPINNGRKEDGSAGPCSVDLVNDDKSSCLHTTVSAENVPGSRIADGVPEKCPSSVPDDLSSPLDSPVRGEIVDISDS